VYFSDSSGIFFIDLHQSLHHHLHHHPFYHCIDPSTTVALLGSDFDSLAYSSLYSTGVVHRHLHDLHLLPASSDENLVVPGVVFLDLLVVVCVVDSVDDPSTSLWLLLLLYPSQKRENYGLEIPIASVEQGLGIVRADE